MWTLPASIKSIKFNCVHFVQIWCAIHEIAFRLRFTLINSKGSLGRFYTLPLEWTTYTECHIIAFFSFLFEPLHLKIQNQLRVSTVRRPSLPRIQDGTLPTFSIAKKTLNPLWHHELDLFFGQYTLLASHVFAQPNTIHTLSHKIWSQQQHE